MIGVNERNKTIKAEPETPCLAMRVREAAKAIGISERTLWQRTEDGYVVIGRFKLGRYGRCQNRSVIFPFIYVLSACSSSRFFPKRAYSMLLFQVCEVCIARTGGAARMGPPQARRSLAAASRAGQAGSILI